MEDVLILILQFIFEVGLQVLAELPWDLFVGRRQTASNPNRPAGPGVWIFLSLIAGAAVGGLSLLIFPTTLLHLPATRMANLAVAPAISGFASAGFSRLWPNRRKPGDPAIRPIAAACFTFALAVIRFTYAARPPR
ncbi:MAG TPA: hypothetical protein VH370_23730 [Humisphaera sp.]|jgi:hypothetical protein|nr:hypothetical protein [Humisphaera sp.]